MAEERISLTEVSFDESGRAVISNPETVARLRAATAGAAAIKNIGCCSIAAQREATDGFKRLSPEEALAIKNIGCCSVA